MMLCYNNESVYDQLFKICERRVINFMIRHLFNGVIHIIVYIIFNVILIRAYSRLRNQERKIRNFYTIGT